MLHRGHPRLQEMAANSLAALTEGPVGAMAAQLSTCPEAVQDLAAMLHVGNFASRYWAATCLTRLVIAQREADSQLEPTARTVTVSEVPSEKDDSS